VVADALSRNPNPFDKPLDPAEALLIPLFSVTCSLDKKEEEELCDFSPIDTEKVDLIHLQLLDSCIR